MYSNQVYVLIGCFYSVLSIDVHYFVITFNVITKCSLFPPDGGSLEPKHVMDKNLI
jgi:hypothetical protein